MNFTNTRAVVETGFIRTRYGVCVSRFQFSVNGSVGDGVNAGYATGVRLAARCALERTFTGDGAVYDGGVDFTVGGTGHRCVWLHRHFAGSRL